MSLSSRPLFTLALPYAPTTSLPCVWHNIDTRNGESFHFSRQLKSVWEENTTTPPSPQFYRGRLVKYESFRIG